MSQLYGKFVWFEHMLGDIVWVCMFYESLFGWHIESMLMGGSEFYLLIINGSEGIGGLCSALVGTFSLWMSYLLVFNVDSAHVVALAVGVKSLLLFIDFGFVGCGVMLVDFTGVVFSIWISA